jgi:hypothetical protein
MATKPTSNWRFTTNTKLAIRSTPGKSSGRRSTNFAAQSKPATLHQAHIVRPRRGLIIDCSVWNARAKDRCWKAPRHELKPKGE